MTADLAALGRRARLMAGAMIAAGLALAQAADAATPSATIDNFHQTLLAVMKEAEKLGVKGRYDRLAPEIDRVFDLAGMIRIASGSAWSKAAPAEQGALLAAFKHMTVGTYASRFDGYSGQSFATDGEKSGPQRTTLVNTHIDRPGKSPVALTYVLIAKDNDWRIIDVLLDTGISELAVRRSEYSRILGTEGVEGLVKALNAKADELVGR